MIPGGLSAASYVKLGWAGWVIAAGSSTRGGFCLLDRETCARILAPGTTCVARPTINPDRASLDILPREAWRRLPTIRCLKDTAALRRDSSRSPLDSDLSQPARDLNVVFPKDAAMAAQFGRAPLVSPPALALGTSAASAGPLLHAPRNVRLDGTMSHFSAGTRVLSPYSVRRRGHFAMAEDFPGAAFFFASAWGHLP